MKLFISAGEASGDMLGARLLAAIARLDTDVEAFGMGGPAMEEQGFRAIRSSNSLGVVGLLEVASHLPRLFRLRDDLAVTAAKSRPDLAVLIDVPDFNVSLAKKLREQGVPCVFYVAPSVWVWRSGRVRSFGKLAERMLVLFPFETELWKDTVDTVCVGHPLIDEIEGPADVAHVQKKTVAILPGSRRSEIERHLDVMIEAAVRLKIEGRADRFVLPLAPGLDPTMFDAARRALPSLELIRSEKEGDATARRTAISQSRLCLVCSGTASLEVALLGRPQRIVYRANPVSWAVGKRLVKVKYIGLPNLILDEACVPELLQADFNEDSLTQSSRECLEDDGALEAARQIALRLRERMGDYGAAERAARAVLEVARRMTKEKHG